MDNNTILKAFNNHFLDFGQDLMNIFPDDYDLKTTYTFLEGLKKINPKKIIEIWKTWILKHYKREIDEGDYKFFENKDYGYDMGQGSNSKLLVSVNNFKHKCSRLNKKNKEKSMKYVQNLSKLCEIYYN
jgi:hypothetical protein